MPFRTFADWTDGLSVPDLDADDTAWQAAIADARPQLRARLAELLGRARVRDALFLASPGLEEQIPAYLAAPHSPQHSKVETALVRYLARMAGRATPFGLFSGISSGRVAERTRLDLVPLARYERHTRLDNDYLFALTDALVRDPTVRNQLTFWPNDSLYRSAGRLRYVEARLTDKRRSHHLVRVDPDEYLDATLARAKDGASADSLARALVADDPEIELDEALAYIDDVIDSQVLVSQLTPAVTGAEPIYGIIDRLSALTEAGVKTAELARARLLEVDEELGRMDRAGLGAAPDDYRDIARRLAPLPVPVDIARLFQVDMVKPVKEATLGAELIAELKRVTTVLQRLALPLPDDPLARFKDNFKARYEDREVPLLLALDEDSGVGFMASGDIAAEPSPLLHGVAFPGAPSAGAQTWTNWHAFLARKISALRTPGDGVLRIKRADIEQLNLPPARPMPDAFSVMATLAAPSREALERGDVTVYFMHAGGPSGARLTGRFCHASQDVEAAVREHLAAEEALDPDAAFAEIVHLPEGRIGNIMCRPVLRAYEIPYLGLSGAGPEQQLPLSDLTVSVVGGRIVLRSRRLNRRVIPRLSTAHNLNLGVGVYRFLGFLQSQGVGGANWSWGPLAGLPYLPRVMCGKVVIQRARWNLDKDALAALSAAAKRRNRAGRRAKKRSSGQKSTTTTEAAPAAVTDQPSADDVQLAAIFRAMNELRARYQLPRFIALIDGDNELPVDLDNPLSCASCAEIVKNRHTVSLAEFFPGPDQMPCHGPEGGYVAQIVVPFVRARAPSAAPRQRSAVTVTRSFAPGSEWLYAKLYTGTGSADRLLCETVAPLAQQFLDAGLIDRWFFIRYRDPESHVRVRWHGSPATLTGEVLPAVHAALAPLMADGSLWTWQLDTYNRELERYGGDGGIDPAEELFWVDSEAVVDMLPYLTGDGNADGRWHMAVLGADALLDDMGFDLDQKLAIMSDMRAGFGREFHADASFYKQIGKPYRERHKRLVELIDWDFRALVPPADAGVPGEASDDAGDDLDDAAYADLACGLALKRRSERMRPIAAELGRRADAGQLAESLRGLAPSYIHMYINRLLRSAQRAQELIIYDYLRRIYDSKRARSRQRKREVRT